MGWMRVLAAVGVDVAGQGEEVAQASGIGMARRGLADVTQKQGIGIFKINVTYLWLCLTGYIFDFICSSDGLLPSPGNPDCVAWKIRRMVCFSKHLARHN